MFEVPSSVLNQTYGMLQVTWNSYVKVNKKTHLIKLPIETFILFTLQTSPKIYTTISKLKLCCSTNRIKFCQITKNFKTTNVLRFTYIINNFKETHKRHSSQKPLPFMKKEKEINKCISIPMSTWIKQFERKIIIMHSIVLHLPCYKELQNNSQKAFNLRFCISLTTQSP